jgi:hypothetical protein
MNEALKGVNDLSDFGKAVEQLVLLKDNEQPQKKQILEGDAITDERIKLQNFAKKLNSNPSFVKPTPDGRAFQVPISHIEMTLDEMFFGLWSTENFRWQVISNEVVGCIDLIVTHPVNGKELRRTGSASMQIMTDAVPDSIKHDAKLKNQWQLSVENKKPNAMGLGFPNLKSECIKNACKSLGKIFGRDLNRKDSDDFNGIIK